MPKRHVKKVSWEVESERLVVKPAMERRIRKAVLQRAEKELSELADASTDEDAFYALPNAASAAYHLGLFKEAERHARRSITLAEQFKDNWNYSNALHAGHTALGLLALRSKSIQQAVEALRASGSVRGSPQLGSFGPTMQLARELLKAGESESVLAYFEQCRSFWKSGSLWLSIWEKKVKRGAMPNFFMNLYR
jgi:tetratricopeptide (TPR) repeat protein